MENEIMNNEEIIETNTNAEPVLAEDDGSAAGMALLVGIGVAGTVAVQQLYKRVLRPIGGKVKAKATGFFKKKDEAEVEIIHTEVTEEKTAE